MFPAVNKVSRYILYSADFGLFLYLSHFRLRDRDTRRSPGTDLGCDNFGDPDETSHPGGPLRRRL